LKSIRVANYLTIYHATNKPKTIEIAPDTVGYFCAIFVPILCEFCAGQPLLTACLTVTLSLVFIIKPHDSDIL